MSFTGGRLKLKGDDGGVKKKKKKKSKAEDESKALQLVVESTAKESVVKVHSSVRKATPSHPPYDDFQPTAWSLCMNTAVHSLLHISFYTGPLYSMGLACLPLKEISEGTCLVLLIEAPFSRGVSEIAEGCIAGDKGRVHS